MNTSIPSTVPILPRRFVRAWVTVVCLAAFFTGMSRVSAQVVVFSNDFSSLAGFAGNMISSNMIFITNGYAQTTGSLGGGGSRFLSASLPNATNVQVTGFTATWDLRAPTTNNDPAPRFWIGGTQPLNQNRFYEYKMALGNGNIAIIAEYLNDSGGGSSTSFSTNINTIWASAAAGDPFDTIQFTFTPNYSSGRPLITLTRNVTNILASWVDTNGARLGVLTAWNMQLTNNVPFRNGGQLDNLVVTIPEPSTVALLLLGAGAVLLRHRHLKRRASGSLPAKDPRN